MKSYANSPPETLDIVYGSVYSNGMKAQIQYRSPQHPKGPDFWQTTRTFKTREAAEKAVEKAKILNPEKQFRVTDK